MSVEEVDPTQTREIDEKIYELNGMLRQSQQLELLQKKLKKRQKHKRRFAKKRTNQ